MTNVQLEAQRYLQEQGIVVDLTDRRSDIEVALALGYMPLEAAGLEVGEPPKTTV